MPMTNTEKQQAWRDRKKAKRLRDEAAFDQVSAAMVVEPRRTPEGWTVSVVLSTSAPEWPIFVDLAASMKMTPAELFTRLLAGARKRMIDGTV